MKILLIGSFITTLISFYATNTLHLTTQYTSVEDIQTPMLKESIERGAIIYKEFCVRCHKAEGEGYQKFYPPLAGSDWLVNKRKESIHAVKFGLKGLITVNGIEYKKNMANPGIDDHEIVDVMNYIMNSWGNSQNKMITTKEVRSVVIE